MNGAWSEIYRRTRFCLRYPYLTAAVNTPLQYHFTFLLVSQPHFSFLARRLKNIWSCSRLISLNRLVPNSGRTCFSKQ